jgi:hypothetical protein
VLVDQGLPHKDRAGDPGEDVRVDIAAHRGVQGVEVTSGEFMAGRLSGGARILPAVAFDIAWRLLINLEIYTG